MSIIPTSENGGPSPELRATITCAREALDRFRNADEAFTRDPYEESAPAYAASCYELAAYLNRLLTLLSGAKGGSEQ